MGRQVEFRELTSSGENCLEGIARLSLSIGQPTVTPEWVLVDALTAVEVHVDRSIETLVNHSGISSTRFGSSLLADLGEGMNKSWHARFQWLADGFGVNVKGGKVAQDLNVVIECRNAIVHGSGRLTKRQQSPFVKFTDLRRRLASVLEVEVHGTRLVLSNSSAHRVLAVSRDFVGGFDQELRRRISFDVK